MQARSLLQPRKYRSKLAGLRAQMLIRYGAPAAAKRAEELAHWTNRWAVEGTFGNGHFEEFFTGAFGLDRVFYAGKRLLDVGCGPRGSLEWAAGLAEECVGIDPLVPDYRKLGIDQHRMRYVHARSEEIPFSDRSFDVVSTFNSLDHVDDIDAAISEICRVAAQTILLITDVNHAPTPSEPQTLGWNVTKAFAAFDAVYVRRFEKRNGGVYESVRAGVAYDDADTTERYGLLLARLDRRVVI